MVSTKLTVIYSDSRGLRLVIPGRSQNGRQHLISALLTGKALDVYSRMPDETAVNYDLLKEALLKRYDLTTDGYRDKFCKSRPQQYENPEQFVTRPKSYLDKWILLSHTDESAIGIKELFMREQFINACRKDLAIHPRERVAKFERDDAGYRKTSGSTQSKLPLRINVIPNICAVRSCRS